MSRVGKKLIEIPKNVEINVTDGKISVKGPKGSQTDTIHSGYRVVMQDGTLQVINENGDSKKAKALYGLVRALIANMIEGVTKGFEVKFELVGVGYRVQKKGDALQFALGFSHPVIVDPMKGVAFDVESQTKFKVSGINRGMVGQMAANIRQLKKPDVYKGKGILFEGEKIKLKEGKRV